VPRAYGDRRCGDVRAACQSRAHRAVTVANQDCRDLKGKRIGVTTLGSLTEWLTRKLSQQQGWGPNGIEVMRLAPCRRGLPQWSAMSSTAWSFESATGYELEEQGKGRNILLFGDIEKHFYTHVILATDDMITKRPELLQRFLRGWFKTVAFMKANKDFTVKSSAKVVQVRESIVSKVYDSQIGGFSTDGAWDMTSLDVIRHSLKDLGNPRFCPGCQDDPQRQVRPGEVLT
jgi:ABC-type nitrate/sulfonate/bicarbonate transport system substrate-binding protein